MIGIQGETALEEVTKSPADAALSTTSTNSVQNKVITKEINEINNDLTVSSDNTSLVGAYIIKQNRNVEIHFQGTYADDIASFTLPSALRPQHDVRNNCFILTSNGTLLGLVRVKADGSIEISAMATYGASLSAVTSHGSRIYGEIKFFTAS